MRLLLLVLGLHACHDSKSEGGGQPPSDDTAPSDDTGETFDPGPPGPEFDRVCRGAAWDDTLAAATVTAVEGEYGGMIGSGYRDEGTLETMKVIPPHPFWVTGLQVAFGSGPGTATFRIMNTWGRSYPASFPDIEDEEANLTSAITVEVGEDPDRDEWVEVDLSNRGIYLEPTQHYMIVHEYPADREPPVAMAQLTEGETSRALLFMPDDINAYGVEGNFRMQLVGSFFCAWPDEDRWFEDTTSEQPFAASTSSTASFADLDGDGHEDLVTFTSGPVAWLGDGAGQFAAPETEAFPDSANASMVILGDLDNDGDQDAVVVTYSGADDDADGVTKEEGDCDDSDADVHPGATETTNGRDQDCDGVADDGTDTSDADGDGTSIAAGDCDDHDASVGPGAAEERNGVDDDCDGLTDEDFAHRVMLNDGSGRFETLPGSGVEHVEPTPAGALGDGNADGVLDLYLGNWLEHYPEDAAVQDRYYEGNGDGSFTDRLALAGMERTRPLSCYGVKWNDWNNDGWQDVFVGNYHLYNNYLWANQGDGTYVDVAGEVGVDHDDITGAPPATRGATPTAVTSATSTTTATWTST